MEWQKFEKLEYLCQTQDDSQVAVVLFHGYGADAHDLSGLADLFGFEQPVDWFFPQGPLKVPIGPMMTGRAWFELRVSDFERLSGGHINDFPLDGAMSEVLQQAARWLNRLGGLYNQVFIGGFSQGAILSSHVFYRLNFSPAGLLLLSGYLVSPSQFPTLSEGHKIPFYQSHGRQDAVLPIGGARKLFDQLVQLGLDGRWLEFNGGHEIPLSVIQSVNAFVNPLLKQKG